MDLLFTNKEELVRYVITNGNVGCSDHEIEELEIQRGARKETEEYRRAHFRLLKQLVGGITTVLKGKGAQGS